MRRSRALAAISVLTLAVLLVGAGPSSAGTGKSKGKDNAVRDTGTDYNKGRPMRIESSGSDNGPPETTPNRTQVGNKRTWLALDDANGSIYLKKYKLRGIGDHIEVWVADDGDGISKNTDFPRGDCRNGIRTTITDEQVAHLIDEFDGNIYPLESETFSTPPARDGSNALLPQIIPRLPDNLYHGEGDNIVVLVDNVRDDNFYDTDNANTLSYIAGFFFSVFNEYFDRNVMTIDAWDWIHRTGDNPPNEPSTDPCTSAPARPNLYESVFAHEYQHLLEYYEDVDEYSWVNEGLSNFSEILTGYADFSIPITETGFDSAVQCFLGNTGIQTPANPITFEGGPENSLTLWGDQNDDPSEILCDYGAASTIMMMLNSRYGTEFMGDLHREDANGLEGLQAGLDAVGAGTTARQVVHDWLAMVALDHQLDGGAALTGGDAGDFTADGIDGAINWDTVQTYSTPGAPPNGADFVRLRDASDAYLSAGEIAEISFNGAATHNPKPIEWTIDNGALYSGAGDNLDRAIIREVAVPANDPTLTFQAQWDTEEFWDFAFVQVSTDGGDTWESLANADTTTEHDPGAVPQVVAELPGFTGSSGGFVPETFDLSAYAGQNILLSFRYITDPSVTLPGFWVDDVTVGGTLISDGSTLDGWSSLTEINPIDVEGFTVQLVAYTDDGTAAWVGDLPLDGDFDGSLSGADVAAQIGTTAETVAALVTYNESSELIPDYAPYTLTVNGVVQPGGAEEAASSPADNLAPVLGAPAPVPAPAPAAEAPAPATNEGTDGSAPAAPEESAGAVSTAPAEQNGRSGSAPGRTK
ncbi:MAG: peptidase M6 [Actinomycetota bacterium]